MITPYRRNETCNEVRKTKITRLYDSKAYVVRKYPNGSLEIVHGPIIEQIELIDTPKNYVLTSGQNQPLICNNNKNIDGSAEIVCTEISDKDNDPPFP